MVDWRNETGTELEITIYDSRNNVLLQERIKNQDQFFTQEHELVEIQGHVLYESHFFGSDEFRTILSV